MLADDDPHVELPTGQSMNQNTIKRCPKVRKVAPGSSLFWAVNSVKFSQAVWKMVYARDVADTRLCVSSDTDEHAHVHTPEQSAHQ